MRYLAYLVPAAVRRPLAGIAFLLAVFAFLCLSAPSPRGIDFAPPAEGVDPVAPSPVPLAERLLPVHALALCLETLAQRITVESTAAFEVFDHAYRDECRSSIAGNPQWRLASEWFGPPFMLAVHGILDSERELVVLAVRDDRAAGRPLRAAVLWRSALTSMASRLREFVRLLVLAYAPARRSRPG